MATDNRLQLNADELERLSPDDLAALYVMLNRVGGLYKDAGMALVWSVGESTVGPDDWQAMVNERQAVYDLFDEELGDTAPTGHSARQVR